MDYRMQSNGMCTLTCSLVRSASRLGWSANSWGWSANTLDLLDCKEHEGQPNSYGCTVFDPCAESSQSHQILGSSYTCNLVTLASTLGSSANS